MLTSPKKYFAGLDAGSRTTKAVVISEDGTMASAIQPTGIHVNRTAESVLALACTRMPIQPEKLCGIVGTGYGRVALSFTDTTATELSCHAQGAYHLDPQVRMVIDVGGQDSKVIHLDEHGTMLDFVMNDKCAAGTGKFLEIVAKNLDMNLAALSNAHFTAERPCQINSMCVVFVESEIISLLARGESPADIIAGVNRAFSVRIGNMVKRLGFRDRCILTGGVAKNRGLAVELSRFLHIPFMPIGIDPQLNGALGAALIARNALQ